MFDVDKVASRIDEEADDNAIIIMGASIKEDLQDEIAVTVIAAGFEKSNVDLLNNSVIPNNHTIDGGTDVSEAAQETAKADKEDPFKGTARIDIPTFLQR